ncbi:MAG: hypothetical protein MI725_09405 [Pirellulales bacterium]|nr:hypothetical protein [Pirellulales bacterium]
MRSLLLVIASFAVTILAWGLYGPVLHWGQYEMSTIGRYARLRPFVCVGLAYFAIGVVVPAVLLKMKGEQGNWTLRGIVYSLAGGTLGAIGALGIIMAFNFGGDPVYVMPLVFGGAPIVNSFLTISMAKRMKDIGPLFLAGLVMVLIGAVTVLIMKPKPAEPAPQESKETATAEAVEETAGAKAEPESSWLRAFILQIASIATTIVCWGAYGPVLHKGQATMHHSRLRPLLCVGLAYFAIAVLVPNLLLLGLPEASEYNWKGSFWSLSAGAAGAIGALGIIMAFNFGGRPVYVMPLVFGGAPVVNTLFSTLTRGLWNEVNAFFLAGLILVIAGAAIVLVFAPKSPPPAKVEAAPATEG